VADTASRHDFKKLADLGFQVPHQHTSATKVSTLCQKLFAFLTTLSPLRQERTTTRREHPMNPSVTTTVTPSFPSQLKQSHIGSRTSCAKRNQRQRRAILKCFDPHISNGAWTQRSLTIPASNSFSGVASGYTVRAKSDCASPLQLQFSGKSLMRLDKLISTASTSKRPSVWHLPPSFDLANLRGIRGTHHPPNTTYPDATLLSTTTTLSPSYYPPQRPTPFAKEPRSNSLPHPLRQSVPSMRSDTCSMLSPGIPPTPCSPDRSVPSTGNTLSTRSRNCSAYPQLDSQAIPSGKALPSLPLQTESPRTASSSWDDGKATLSMSISTKSTNSNTPENYLLSTLNSTTSRLLNSALTWLQRINDYALGNPFGLIATSSTGT